MLFGRYFRLRFVERQGTSFDDRGCAEHEGDGDPPGLPKKM